MIVLENAVVDGENVITAYSGDVKANTITLNGVAEHDYAYDLPEGNQGANWFDDPAAIAARAAFKYPKGYYSIKDKVGVLMSNPETAAILGATLAKVMGSAGSLMGSDMEMGDSMKEFMNMMRLSDMLKMYGGAVDAETKLALNQSSVLQSYPAFSGQPTRCASYANFRQRSYFPGNRCAWSHRPRPPMFPAKPSCV